MELKPEKSLCDIKQTKIVSTEKGRKHIAVNPGGKYNVRQYRLDGDLVFQELCCDFDVLNDNAQKAYYIELKGKDIKHAVDQVVAGEKLCEKILSQYISYYRIIASKSPTIELFPRNYKKLLQTVGNKRLICKTQKYEEILE